MKGRKEKIFAQFEKGKTPHQVNSLGLQRSTVKKYWCEWKNGSNPTPTATESLLYIQEKIDELIAKVFNLEGKFSGHQKMLYGMFLTLGIMATWLIRLSLH